MVKGKEKTASELYFDANPKKEVVFGTTDGFLFEEKYFAKLHGDTLEEGKKEVETFKNALQLETEFEKISDSSHQLTAEEKELLENGLVKEKYSALKVLVKNLKIETADQKAETIIKALEDYKVKNSNQE